MQAEVLTNNMASHTKSHKSLTKWNQFPTEDFLSHLTSEVRDRYNDKLSSLDVYDPYKAPSQLFRCLRATMSLPDIDFGDIWVYLVYNPSPYTAKEMKSFKATDSHRYAVSGWVNWPIIWTLEKKDRPKFHVIKARVSVSICSYQKKYWVMERELLIFFLH